MSSVSCQIVKNWNNHDKNLSGFEEFENKSLIAANSSKMSVHLLKIEYQSVTTGMVEVCNFFADFLVP